MSPETHSEFLPDDLCDGLRDALFYSKQQELDFAVDRAETMKGSGSLPLCSWMFLSPPLTTLQNSPSPPDTATEFVVGNVLEKTHHERVCSA